MIHFYEGTIFNVGAKALVNTVNCDGFMGTGIAQEFALRFPDMLSEYEIMCREKSIVPGKLHYYENADCTIVNFPTKYSFKYPSRIEWIESGLQNFVETYRNHKIKSVAFPKLGTNNGGLIWSEVKPLMEKYLAELDIDVYICLDEMKSAEGIEKDMIDGFNGASVDHLSTIVKLTTKQKAIIEKACPLDRFWKISKLPLIGKKTYAILFTHYYNVATQKIDEEYQQSMFD